MSKISRDKKKDALKNKNANADKSQPKEKQATKSAEEQILNYKKCCTCRFRNIEKVCVGKTSPKNGQHVARKLDACQCYKCK